MATSSSFFFCPHRRFHTEFYAYLQQTDANLLNFSDDEEEKGSEDEEKGAPGAAGGDEDEDEEDDEAKEPGGPSLTVTVALLSKWCEVAKRQAPLGTMKNLMKAYRMACHHGSTEEGMAANMKIASASGE